MRKENKMELDKNILKCYYLNGVEQYTILDLFWETKPEEVVEAIKKLHESLTHNELYTRDRILEVRDKVMLLRLHKLGVDTLKLLEDKTAEIKCSLKDVEEQLEKLACVDSQNTV